MMMMTTMLDHSDDDDDNDHSDDADKSNPKYGLKASKRQSPIKGVFFCF